MASIQIHVLYASYSISTGWTRVTTVVYPAPTVAAQQHEIIGEALPELTMDLEGEKTGQFPAGEITITARNDDLWWNTPPYGTGAFSMPDPYLVHGADAVYKPATVRIIKDGLLRWEGDIDLATVTYDRKLQTVTFTAIGALGRLATHTAETVRRPFPTYVDSGAASSCGVGVLNDTSKAWVVNRYAGHVMIDLGNTVWTIASNTATQLVLINRYPSTAATTPATGTYTIHPMCLTSWVVASSSTSVGANTLTDTSQSWATNAWAGYYCEDSAGAVWPIASNTATALTLTAGGATPAAGSYRIIFGSARRVLKSRGPSCVSIGLRIGDKLLITGSLQSGLAISERSPSSFFSDRTEWQAQEVEIQFAPEDGGTATAVGALTISDTSKTWTTNEWYLYWACYLSGGAWQSVQIASNTTNQLTLVGGSAAPDASTPYTILKYQHPALQADEVWIKDDLDTHVLMRDAVVVTTPYHRDMLVEDLVRLLYAAAYVTSPRVLLPSAFAAKPVPYADFEGKSVADALGELASITGCALFVQCGGDSTVDFHFRDRSQGTGAVRYVAAALMRQDEGLLWDRFADGVVVKGAEDRTVVRGSRRYGGSQLEVSSDFVSSYSWLRAIADWLWGFFGVQRRPAEVDVLAEFTADNLLTFEADAWYVLPSGWDVISGSAAAWAVDQASGSTDRELLGETLSGSVHSAVGCGYLFEVVDSDFQADIFIGQYNYPFGIFVRGDAASAYVVAMTPVSGVDTLGIYSTNWTTEVTLATAAASISLNTWYSLRVQASGSTIRARFWAAGGTEPSTWAVTYVGASAVSGATGLFASKSAYKYAFFDNIKWPGTQWNLGDRANLDGGSDEWLVVGVTEALEEAPTAVRLRLITSTGTAYTPDDEQTDDPDTTPEPPVIAGVSSGGGFIRYVDLDWLWTTEKIAGVLYNPWPENGPRPEGMPYMKSIGDGVVYLGGYRWRLTLGTSGLPAGPWMVDVAIVLADGRISKESDPVAFA